MSGEPIMVPCEGSNSRGHYMGTSQWSALCPMCGMPSMVALATGLILPHERDDILARIERGDFDARPIHPRRHQ